MPELVEDILNREKIGENIEVLQERFIPQGVPLHRTKEITDVTYYIGQIFRSNIPRHCFIYGKMGTGKTIVIKYIVDEILQRATKTNTNIHAHLVICKFNRTINSILRDINNKFSTSPTSLRGYTIDERIDQLVDTLNKIGGHFLIVLDEVDQVSHAQEDQTDIFYILTRLFTSEKLAKNVTISVVAISNDLKFYEELDGRIKSSFGQTEFIFPPYTAPQLLDILNQRIKLAKIPESKIEPGAIQICAALVGQSTGDARRAIEILRTAIELAEKSGETVLREKNVRDAHIKIEVDRVVETVKTYPLHYKIVLMAIMLLEENGGKKQFTGEIYDVYRELAKLLREEPLTPRRITDVVSDIETMGIISAPKISRGRYGRTRQVSLAMPISLLGDTVFEDVLFREILEDRRNLMVKIGLGDKKQTPLKKYF